MARIGESADLLKRGYPADGLDPTQAGPSLQMVTEAILLEVQKTLDFFRGTTGADHIDLLLVTGGGAQVTGLVEALHTRLGYPVEFLDPFKTVSFDPAKHTVRTFDLGGFDAELEDPDVFSWVDIQAPDIAPMNEVLRRMDIDLVLVSHFDRPEVLPRIAERSAKR